MGVDPFVGSDGTLPLSRAAVFFDGQYSEPRIHHPEGVAVGPDGAVWCGNAEGDILRIEPDGSRVEKIASTGGFSLGLAFDGDGHLFVCDQRSAAVWRLDLATRALARFTPPGIRIPNYPWSTPRGIVSTSPTVSAPARTALAYGVTTSPQARATSGGPSR